MDTQSPQPGPSGFESSWLAGALTNSSLIGTQHERRHQLVYCDAANAATRNMTQDAHLKIVRKTGSSTNKKQHAVRCEYIHPVVKVCQFTVFNAPGVRWELLDQCIAARNGKTPSSDKPFIHIVHEIQHHDVVSSGIFADRFSDQHPWEWMKQALITLVKVTEADKVEVITTSHCLTQQLISCRNSTCLLRW